MWLAKTATLPTEPSGGRPRVSPARNLHAPPCNNFPSAETTAKYTNISPSHPSGLTQESLRNYIQKTNGPREGTRAPQRIWNLRLTLVKARANLQTTAGATGAIHSSSIYPSICPSIHPSFHPCIYPSIHPSMHCC